MNYPHPFIAREGWPFIALSLALALLASSSGFWSLPFWLIFIFCVQFFRDPARVIAGGPKSVVAPADGRIVVVEEADDPYLNRRALKVSVFMNVFNVHSNRSPIASRILNYVEPGAALTAGQRYGFIRFGSRVDLYLPLDTQVKVVIGDKVSASSTVLAELS